MTCSNGSVPAEPHRDRTASRDGGLRVAESRATSGVPAFVYRFDWTAPGLGAAHAVDIPFTFGTFDREGWGDAVGYDPTRRV
jgi:para-nitrobenzyl esterase